MAKIRWCRSAVKGEVVHDFYLKNRGLVFSACCESWGWFAGLWHRFSTELECWWVFFCGGGDWMTGFYGNCPTTWMCRSLRKHKRSGFNNRRCCVTVLRVCPWAPPSDSRGRLLNLDSLGRGQMNGKLNWILTGIFEWDWKSGGAI